jgi:hypothetical protein
MPRKTDFTFANSIALSTPSVRVATGVETIPAKEVPAETRVASWIVESMRVAGTTTARAS